MTIYIQFNRTIQEEYIDQNEIYFDNIEQCNKEMLEWIMWYNTKRYHWSLNLQSPVDYLINNNMVSNIGGLAQQAVFIHNCVIINILNVIHNYMDYQPTEPTEPTEPTLTPDDSTESIKSKPAGFWRRFVAISIDDLIVGTSVMFLLLPFKNLLLSLGENLWYIGFIILGFYFTILNSHIGKGQTIGKKILGIRIVYNKNEFLTISQSFTRYLFLCPIIFYNGIILSFDSIGINYLTMIFSLISIFIFFGVVGLMIFTKEKRGLHDYLLKTVVIRSKSSKDIKISHIDTLKEASVKHKKAFLSLLIIFVLILIISTFISQTVENKQVGGVDFRPMLELRKDLKDNHSLSNIGVSSGSEVFYSWEGEKEIMQKRLKISADVKYSIFNDDSARNYLFEQVYDKVLLSYPNLENYDEVVISFRSGYNLGIGKIYMSDFKRYPQKSE